MFKTLLTSATRLRGAPFTAISLAVIAVVGGTLLYDRPSPASAATVPRSSQQLPNCVATDGEFTIPAQLHIPVSATDLEAINDIPQSASITDTLIYSIPITPTTVTATGVVSASGEYDLSQFEDTDEILKLPKQLTFSNTNGWTLVVDGTTETFDPNNLDDQLKSFLEIFVREYASSNASNFELASLPISGSESLINLEPSLAESFGDSLNSVLFDITDGDIPNYSIIVTYTRAFNSLLTGDQEISATDPLLIITPTVDYSLEVGGNSIVSDEIDLSGLSIGNSLQLASSIVTANGTLHDGIRSQTCGFLNSLSVTEALADLRATPQAVAGGQVNSSITRSATYTYTNDIVGGNTIYLPVVLKNSQANIVINDPAGNIFTEPLSSSLQPFVIDNAVTGTWSFQVVQVDGSPQYAVVVGTGEVADFGDALGKGYWKNHQPHLSQLLAPDILLGDTTVATVEEAVAVLSNAKAKDARDALRAHLLATILNLRNGSDPLATGEDIVPEVDDARSFLASHSDPVTGDDPDRDEALGLKDKLEAYNDSGEE